MRYLTKVLGLDYTQEEVNHVIGLLEVNAYEVEVKAERGVGVGRGVFPLLAKLNHSCVSNARWGVVVYLQFIIVVHTGTLKLYTLYKAYTSRHSARL